MSTQLAPSSGDASVRSETYYYDTVVFGVSLPSGLASNGPDAWVEGTLYRVCKYGFVQWSQSVFRDMFSLPQGLDGGLREGDSDDNPIKLCGCTRSEFESLLEVIQPRRLIGPPDLSNEQWIHVIRLALMWDMPEVAAIAKKKLVSSTDLSKEQCIHLLGLGRKSDMRELARSSKEKLETFNLSPIEKVELGREHGISSWIRDGYVALIGDDLSQVSLEQIKGLGLETALLILWSRAQVPYQHDLETLLCGRCLYDGRREHRLIRRPGDVNGRLYCGECRLIATDASCPYKPVKLADVRGENALHLVADRVSEAFREELKEVEMRFGD